MNYRQEQNLPTQQIGVDPTWCQDGSGKWLINRMWTRSSYNSTVGMMAFHKYDPNLLVPHLAHLL